MLLICVDYHASFQTIAFFDEETGECGEQELNHSDGQAEKFYRDIWKSHASTNRKPARERFPRRRTAGAIPP